MDFGWLCIQEEAAASKEPLPEVADTQSTTDSQSSLVVLPDTYSLSSDQDDGRRMSQGLIGEALSSVNSFLGANTVSPHGIGFNNKHYLSIKNM